MTEQIKNIPYVKQYDADGVLTNPITTGITNPFPNRAERRAELTSKPFKGNKKGISLTVVNNGVGSIKYERVQQLISLGNGKFKTVNHYKQR